MKKILLLFFGIIALILWFYYIDPQQTWEGIKSIHLSYLVIGYIFFFLTHFLKMVRWALILARIRKVPLRKIFDYYWASIFINTFMPVRIGDVSKTFFLKKDYDIDISASVSSIFVDRFYGVLIRLIVIGFIPLFAVNLYSYLKNYFIYVSSISLVLLLLLFALLIDYRWLSYIVRVIFFFLPASWKGYINSFIQALVTNIKKIHLYKRDIFLFSFLTILGLLAQAYLVSYFFKAVGVEMPISIFIITATIMDFLVMLPSPPGSIGTTEWYTNIIYTIGLGISKNTVASMTLLTHGINLGIFIILGMISLAAIGEGIFRKRDLAVRA